jgi:hypothetical protein
MKHIDFRRKTQALAEQARVAALNNPYPKEQTHADEDHEERPEDRQGPREDGPQGQGEGRSAREEGGAGQVKDGPIEGRHHVYGFFVGPELTDDAWKETRKQLGDEEP